VVAEHAGEPAFAFVAIFGGLDEIHQQYVPLRDASMKEVVGDALGGLAGVFSYHILSRRAIAKS